MRGIHPKLALRINLVLILMISWPALDCYGQMNQTDRFEIGYKYSDGIFSIISLKEEGLLLIRDKDKYENGKKIWELVILGPDLKEKRTINLPMENRNRLIAYESCPGQVYLLYRQGETEKNDLELVEVNLEGDEHPRFILRPELALNFTHFCKVGKSIVLGGYVNKEPSILLYDLENKSMKVLPGFFQKDTELVDLRVNINQTFNVVLIERSLSDERKLVFQTYDQFGKMLLEDVVSINNKLTLQTGMTSSLVREDLILVGTWGEGKAKQSNGFYALPVDPFSDQKIQYVTFGELNHYLDFQKENKAKRIKENTRDEIRRGGIPNYINYVMPYRLLEYDKGFLLFAEAYTPSSSFGDYSRPYYPYYYNPYYSPYGWYYPSYGRLYARPYSYGYNSRNDEIKTYESVVISFDHQGQVQWDSSLELDHIKQSSLDQVADFHYLNGQVVFIYKDESELRAKWIDLDNPDAEFITQKIKLTNSADETRSEKEDEGGVLYWYGNSFYVWGYQTIRNPTLEDRVRDVFYINKIEVN
jgi:hypothetical protein